MGSKFYGKLLPDYGNLDNKTGTAPGYRVYVLENDGGISIQIIKADQNPVLEEGYSVFLNVDEAKEIIEALQKAVVRAEPKKANHKARGVNC